MFLSSMPHNNKPLACERHSYRNLPLTIKLYYINLIIGINSIPNSNRRTAMMKDRQFPGFQNMISASSPDTILRTHETHLLHNQATSADCHLEHLEAIPRHALAYKQGYRSTYKIVFATYKGWKVYQNHTGCFAFIPEYETATA